MKTNKLNVSLVRAIVFCLLTTSAFLFTTNRNSIAQSTCASELNLTNYYYQVFDCDKQCTPGVFICVNPSNHVPSAQSCSPACSTEAANCKWVHIRNLTGCPIPVSIKNVTMTMYKDPISSSMAMCDPIIQWGGPGFTTPWTMYDLTGGGRLTLNSGFCLIWGLFPTRTIEIKPMLNGSPDPNYFLQCLQHLTFTVCGVDHIDFQIFFTDGNSSTFTSSAVANEQVYSDCPEQVDQKGWENRPNLWPHCP